MTKFSLLQKLLKSRGVKSYKETDDGLVAIKKSLVAGRRDFMWIYYRYDYKLDKYILTGSTRRFQR